MAFRLAARLAGYRAPLGWPAGLRTALETHKAGDAIAVEPHQMFRRQTDLFVQAHIGKTPLDVGADRIARTAHAALRILGELRTELELQIPLCWNADDVRSVEVIEVYPAATLSARGTRSSGYKKPEQSLARQEIAADLGVTLTLDVTSADITRTGDTLDSVVCLLAAKDFLDGRAVPPVNRALASQEGWICGARRRGQIEAAAGHATGRFRTGCQRWCHVSGLRPEELQGMAFGLGFARRSQVPWSSGRHAG